MASSSTRVHIDVRPAPPDASVDELRAALGSRPLSIPSRYFYDARGSALFEEITTLPEYYLTRSEAHLLERSAAEIARRVAPRTLVELGSGAATKTRILLDAMIGRGLERYVPFDVDETSVRRTAAELVEVYPGLRVHGVVGDFLSDLDALPPGRDRLVAFLGSTVGNLDRDETVSFFRRLAAILAPADSFLLGVDLIKEPARLHAAYNDSAGVTARFNLNILDVVNRRFGADFDREAFRHRARFDAATGRVEMHVVAREPQTVRVAALDLEIRIHAGEAIRTEISTKYGRQQVEDLLAAGGFAIRQWIEHSGGDFALALARLALERDSRRSPRL